MASPTQVQPVVISDDESEPGTSSDIAPPKKSTRQALEADNPQKKSRRWCITWQLDDGEVFDMLWLPLAEIHYAVGQHEIAPSTGKRHFQAYIHTEKLVKFKTVKNWWPLSNPHIEAAKGTEQQNKDYCTKAETRQPGTEPIEYKPENFQGDSGKQGKRSDLEDVAKLIKDGAPMETVAREHSAQYIRYHQGFHALKDIVAPKPPTFRPVQVIIFYGASGTGKSFRVRTEWPDAYLVPTGKNCWDNYAGEDTIVFEEWDSNAWELREMNKYLDNYKIQLACRYRNKYAAWTRVVILVNDSPDQLYLNKYAAQEPLLFAAWRRRITGHCWEITQRQDQGGPSCSEILHSPPTF